MRIHSALDDIYSEYLISQVNSSVQRVYHNDPHCRVCQHGSSGLLLTSAPIANPYPNPERKPKFQKEVQGGPQGTHWYHGTSWNAGYNDPEQHEHLQSPGPEDSHEYGARVPQHWNTDLGTHFSSIKDVANSFAEREKEWGDRAYSRIAHAHLHMKNPKIYKDEDEFGRDAARYALSKGKTFLPNNEQARRDFIAGNDMMDSPGTQGQDYERNHYLNSVQNESVPHSIADIDKHGPDAIFGKSSPYSGTPRFGTDEIENWLGRHPEREEITNGFRKQLLGNGHDGIIYGNAYEGPHNHPSAIAFPETPVGIHHWEYTHPDELAEKPKGREVPIHPDQQYLF